MGKNIVVNNGRNILTFDCETGLIVHANNLPGWVPDTTEEYKDWLDSGWDADMEVLKNKPTQPVTPYIRPATVQRIYAENVQK
jgi:hypothetical protein